MPRRAALFGGGIQHVFKTLNTSRTVFIGPSRDSARAPSFVTANKNTPKTTTQQNIMNKREISIMVSRLYGSSHYHNTAIIWVLAPRTQLLLKRFANCEIALRHLRRNFSISQE